MRRIHPDGLRGRASRLREGAELEFSSTGGDVVELEVTGQRDGAEDVVAAEGDVDEVAGLVDGDDVGAVSPGAMSPFALFFHNGSIRVYRDWMLLGA